MMAILTRSDRAPPKEDADGSALFKTMLAYTGNFRARAITSSSLMSISLGIPLGTTPSRPGFSRSRATPFRSRPLSKPTPCFRAGWGEALLLGQGPDLLFGSRRGAWNIDGNRGRHALFW